MESRKSFQVIHLHALQALHGDFNCDFQDHCQQAAEKALKGWLTYQKIEFRKTHDLIELLAQCVDGQPAFAVLSNSAIFLVPFATQFRYPGDVFEPPIEEATSAITHATEIVTFVKTALKAANPQAFADIQI